MGNHGLLYRLHETAIRTLYAQVKQRADGTPELLPGTPGTLVKHASAVPFFDYPLEGSRDAGILTGGHFG